VSNRIRLRIGLAVVAAAFASSTLGPLAARAQSAGPGYSPPRTADGHPDLQGVWRAWNLAKFDLEDHGAKPGVPAGLGFVVDPADRKIPYQPWALEQRAKNYASTRSDDPVANGDPLAKCYMPGIPRYTYLGFPFQILQTRGYVAFSYEWSHHRRIVPIDSTAPVPEDEETWLGVPRGRFEGNALVVVSTHFNNDTWFDMAGNFHSNALRVTERYTPVDADTLQYDVTIEDPKVFTRPWSIRMPIQRQKDIGILDYECTALLDERGIHHTWPRDWDAN